MNKSPLKFATAFAKLKNRLRSLPSADRQLEELVEFWDTLLPHLSDGTYRSYVEEYVRWIELSVSDRSLSDFGLQKLSKLSDLVCQLDSELSSMQTALQSIKKEQAIQFFYVGDCENGWGIIAELAGKPDVDFPTDISIEGPSPFEILTELESIATDPIKSYLSPILAEWSEKRSSLRHDRIWCLFVERSDGKLASLGRLRALEGQVELESKPDRVDELSFQNQICIPDDPFVGAGYDAFEAVRRYHRQHGLMSSKESQFHAHFKILDTEAAFAGDSIGMAIALIAHTQLMKERIDRHERFLPGDIAATGVISKDGLIEGVNEESMPAKIERAFFSHLEYLIIPQANREQAENELKCWQREYPRRNLKLISSACLSDLLEDRNVIRPEKVCPAQYATRIAYKYSRATTVQVPLLVGLIYLLICLLFPKAWVGFDWNPQYVTLTERGFEALNKDSVNVWGVEYECESIADGSEWEIGDMKDDGSKIITFAPQTQTSSKCERMGNFYVYDQQGNEMFVRSSVIYDKYPSAPDEHLYPRPELAYIKNASSPMILTVTSQSMPSRAFIRTWSPDGDSLGWYINAGTAHPLPGLFSQDINGKLIFLGINNRINAGCFFVLPADGFSGVSPPYVDSTYDLTGVEPGNQECYNLFPPSEACLVRGYPYNSPQCFEFSSDTTIRVDICPEPALLVRPMIRYHLDTKNDYRVYKVDFEDEYIRFRKRLGDFGELPPVNWQQHRNDLLNAVTYWTDSGWVTEGELRALEATQ